MATFQSTLSMRRATEWCNPQPSTDEISIHALHEESDLIKARMRKNEMISIHALHEESDLNDADQTLATNQFQSTLSMRRATVQLDIFVRFLRRKPAA